VSRGVYLPVLSPEEEQQGAQLLRETAEAFELATYSGSEVEEELLRLLARIARSVYHGSGTHGHLLLRYSFWREVNRTVGDG
jgi:hypothetical protein